MDSKAAHRIELGTTSNDGPETAIHRESNSGSDKSKPLSKTLRDRESNSASGEQPGPASEDDDPMGSVKRSIEVIWKWFTVVSELKLEEMRRDARDPEQVERYVRYLLAQQKTAWRTELRALELFRARYLKSDDDDKPRRQLMRKAIDLLPIRMEERWTLDFGERYVEAFEHALANHMDAFLKLKEEWDQVIDDFAAEFGPEWEDWGS